MSTRTFDRVPQVTVPEAVFGTAKVERFDVLETGSQFSGTREQVPPGQYTRLVVDGVLCVTDTPADRCDRLELAVWADRCGAQSALVNGLGLGLAVNALLLVDTMRYIDVVELNTDVIALVGPHYEQLAQEYGKAVRIRHGDARPPCRVFPAGSRWEVVWNDIWSTICADDYEEHKRMRRYYGRLSNWQGVWCGDEVRRLATGR